MRVVTNKKRAQQLRVVTIDGGLHARPPCEHRAPCPDLWRPGEDRKVAQLIEHVEISKDQREHRVYQAEVFSGKERA